MAINSRGILFSGIGHGSQTADVSQESIYRRPLLGAESGAAHAEG